MKQRPEPDMKMDVQDFLSGRPSNKDNKFVKSYFFSKNIYLSNKDTFLKG